MDPLTGALIIVACLLASAFFAASETALLREGPLALAVEVREARGPFAFALRDLLGSRPRLLVTILLASGLANVLAPSVATALAVRWLGDPGGIAAATLVMTASILVFGGILPKALAAAHPRFASRVVALPLYLVHKALSPVHALFGGILEPFARRPAHPLAGLGSAARAAGVTAQEIMVPRAEIVAFPKGTRPSDLLEKVLEERYTRVLIYEGSLDTILGTVHLKDLVRLLSSDGTDLSSILKPVLRVPGRKPILRLLADLQRSFAHVAVVTDEAGVTLGLVTQEDVLEEIVGEIGDELDREELLGDPRAVRARL